MKKIILSVVFVVLGLTTGCRLGCAPYDCCGPIYSNPHNCDPNYRSGSAFNADCQCAGGVVSETPVTPATQAPVEATPAIAPTVAPTTTPTVAPVAPVETPATPAEVPAQVPATPVATPVVPAPTATPAPLPSGEIPVETQIMPQ